MGKLRTDETWHRLREWTYGQTPSERLAAQILIHENYTDLDPSHPLGGKDGGRDAICMRNGLRWVMAVYFPRGQQRPSETRSKFAEDLQGVGSNQAAGIAFVTNQELTLSERQDLRDLATGVRAEIYHLERISTILDAPAMATVRKLFLGIDPDERSMVHLGGEGGRAPGAGGGGGGAMGEGATGGDGGRGGNIQLDGHHGEAPGAGGGGGGSIGPGAIGGEGGEGGQVVSELFRVADLKLPIEIVVGRGGRGGQDGGDGSDGGDTRFGDLLVAKGGRSGKGSGTAPQPRAATPADVERGLRVSGMYLANHVEIRDGLVYALSAGWEHQEVPRLPADIRWPLVCAVSFGGVGAEEVIEFRVVTFTPTGDAAAAQHFAVARGDARAVARPNVLLMVEFHADQAGVWSIAIESGGIELARLPIELRVRA